MYICTLFVLALYVFVLFFFCYCCFYLGVDKHYIGPVGRPSGSLSPSFQKNARLMGRLGSGPRLVADRADVVCTHVRLYLLFQLLYLTAIRPLGRKDVHKLTD